MGRIAVAVLVLSLLLAGAFAHPGWGCGRHKEGRPSLNCREIHPISSSRGFENIIEGHQFVLATFYTPTCPYSQQLLATLGPLVATGPFADKVVFVSIDVTANNDLGSSEHIDRVPIMKLWKDGALAATMEGSQTADVITNWLNKLTIHIHTMFSPEARSAKVVLVGFYNFIYNPKLSRNTPVDTHTALFSDVATLLAKTDSDIVFAESIAPLKINASGWVLRSFGVSGKALPTFGVVTRVNFGNTRFSVTRVWDENSKVAMTAEAVVAWVTECVATQFKTCPEYLQSEPAVANAPEHLQVYNANALSDAIAKPEDVYLLFSRDILDLGHSVTLDRIAQRLAAAKVDSVTVASINMTSNTIPAHLVLQLKKSHVLYPPRFVLFPANDKSKPIFFNNQIVFSEQNVMDFIVKTASTKFGVPPVLKPSSDTNGNGNSDPHTDGNTNSHTDVNPLEFASRWGRIMNTVYTWLGIYWIKF